MTERAYNITYTDTPGVGVRDVKVNGNAVQYVTDRWGYAYLKIEDINLSLYARVTICPHNACT